MIAGGHGSALHNSPEIRSGRAQFPAGSILREAGRRPRIEGDGARFHEPLQQAERLFRSLARGRASTAMRPPMIGDPDARAAIAKVWDVRRCLALIGRPIFGADDRPL